jgi:hypothetical protein
MSNPNFFPPTSSDQQNNNSFASNANYTLHLGIEMVDDSIHARNGAIPVYRAVVITALVRGRAFSRQ